MRTASFLIPFYATFFVAFSSSSLNFRNLINESVSNDSIYQHITGEREVIKEVTLNRIREKICIYLECDRGVTFKNKNFTDRIRNNKTAPTCKEGKLQSEPSELTNDTTCMKFRIPAHIAHNSLAINKADLFIHIKKKGTRKAQNSRNSRKNRRITLKISDFTVEGGRGKKINARFKFRPSETKFYRVALPVSYLTEIKKTATRNLHLCITCIKCNRKTSITFPLKKKVFRAPRRRKLKLKKNRPYLKIKAKTPFKKRTKRGRSIEHADCLQQKYLRFSNIGLGKVILRPRGFHITTCSRTCISNDVELPEMHRGVGKLNKRQSKSHVIRKKDIIVSRNSTNMDIIIKRKLLLNSFHSCKPSGYQHRQFDAVMDDLTVSKINVRVQNADFQRCNCQKSCS